MRLQLKIACLRAGKPQYKLAAEAGIDPALFSKFVGGRDHPNRDEERRIRKALGPHGSGDELFSNGPLDGKPLPAGSLSTEMAGNVQEVLSALAEDASAGDREVLARLMLNLAPVALKR